MDFSLEGAVKPDSGDVVAIGAGNNAVTDPV